VRHVQFFGYHRCSYTEFDDKLNAWPRPAGSCCPPCR